MKNVPSWTNDFAMIDELLHFYFVIFAAVIIFLVVLFIVVIIFMVICSTFSIMYDALEDILSFIGHYLIHGNKMRRNNLVVRYMYVFHLLKMYTGYMIPLSIILLAVKAYIVIILYRDYHIPIYFTIPIFGTLAFVNYLIILYQLYNNNTIIQYSMEQFIKDNSSKIE